MLTFVNKVLNFNTITKHIYIFLSYPLFLVNWCGSESGVKFVTGTEGNKNKCVWTGHFVIRTGLLGVRFTRCHFGNGKLWTVFCIELSV